MSGYEFLKFLHVAAVIAWVGAPVFLTVLQAALKRAGDMATVMAIGRQMETTGKLYFSLLSTATLVTGILMVATTDGLSFTDPWILIGFGGIAATMGIGLGAIAPTAKKLIGAAQATPPDGAAIAGLAQRMTTLTTVNIVILFFVVWAMITKPGI